MFTARQLIDTARALAFKQQGQLAPNADPSAQLAVRRPGVRVAAKQLARYRHCCGLPAGERTLPVAFVETLFVGPLAELAIMPQFPVQPLGLIHLRQTISQHRAIESSATLDLCCRLAEVATSERGVEMTCELEVDEAGERVWQGSIYFLSRKTQSAGGARKAGQHAAPLDENRTLHQVAEDMGRQYAMASGDYNPHHLHRLTARPLGYKRPIVHGMWTLARALGLLGTIPPAVEIDAQFKRPLYLPGTFSFAYLERDGQTTFEVRNPQNNEPHLLGSLRAR
ncbi:MAG: hypothetical protein H6707_09865 [Deltaproteobacteria bacterium]|nr:hypothetical protein [Deltaproteobacteria bacterium]